MPGQGRPKLTKKDITIVELMQISKQYYAKYDDKKARARQDITSAKIRARNNYTYDRSTRKWTKTGRNVKFIFAVSSSPTSYKKTDTLKKHTYPVVVLLEDINMGILSPFRWRTGSNKRPQFAQKGDSKKKRIKIANQNIRNGIQLNFYFSLENILSRYGLLYGPDLTNKKLPKKTNPELFPYADKHFYYVLTKILIPLFNSPEGRTAIGTVVKNE